MTTVSICVARVAGEGAWLCDDPLSGGLRSTTLSPSPVFGGHAVRVARVLRSRTIAKASHCAVPGHPLATERSHHCCRVLIPTTSLGCVAKICSCKIAGLRSSATRAGGFLDASNSLCLKTCACKCRCRVMRQAHKTWTEEVRGHTTDDQCMCVIVDKGPPALRRHAMAWHSITIGRHILTHGSRGDLYAELQPQCVGNTPLAPGEIVACHLPDERLQLHRDGRTSRA
jgi:hypothetical protein